MKIDVIYFVISCLVQLALFSPLTTRIAPDFLSADNYVIWAVFCGVGFGVYPWVRPFPNVAPRFYLAFVCVHLFAIFLISTAVSFTVVGASAPNHFAEWQTSLAFMAIPSSLVGAVVFLFSYATFCFRRHA